MNTWILWMRRAWDRHRERRRMRLACEALMDLDDRTLRDLGFDRSEAMSVAIELMSGADRTRLNAGPAPADLAGSCRVPTAAGCAVL